MDRYTKVTRQSWFSRLMSSFMGVVFGFLMFLGSFWLLFWNEGKVNLSKLAKKAVMVSPQGKAPADADGKLVSITGKMMSDSPIGDDFLKEGEYLSIQREVEMYAWEEDSQTRTRKNIGGSETKKTTYTYDKKWTSTPENSSRFEVPEGHRNPEMSYQSKTIQVSRASIGDYDVEAADLTMPKHESLSLTESLVQLSDDFKLINSEYLFSGYGSLSNPQVGDLRVSYKVVRNPLEKATVLGQLNDKSLSVYIGERNVHFFRAFRGSHEEAVSILKREHKIMTWIFRGLGFMLMWIGLMLILGPISTFLDLIPLAGRLTRNIIALASFGVSFILSLATIILSMILHNIYLMIFVLAGIAVLIILYAKQRKKKKETY